MRRSTTAILVVSAALNVLLLAAVFTPKHPAPAAASIIPTDSNGPVVLTKYSVVARKQSFNWSEVESPDYRLYIGHLREIGCPEQTIRDIVIADVDKLYQNKRLEEMPTLQQEWWRSDADTNLLQAASQKSDALDRERRALLDTLLGPNWNVEDAERPLLPLNGPLLGDLSSETKQAVRDIVLRAQKQAELTATNSNPSSNTWAAATIEHQVRADLAKLLTPPQLEEFLLRYSSTAAQLRSQLAGFDVTPDQFRRMFELRDPIVQQLELSNAGQLPDTARADLLKELDDTIKTVLGPGQYRAYQLSQDPAYRNATELAANYGASSNVVDKLYQVDLLTRQELDRIRQDPTLTPEEKDAQIKAVQQQSKAASDNLLGVTPPPAPPQPPVPTPPPPVAIHPYEAGETIDLIAAKYGVTPGAIIIANPDLNLTALARGTPIKVPLLAPPQPPPAR